MQLSDQTALNLAEWGKPYFWSDGQRQSMQYTALTPELTADGRSIWTPVWNDAQREWQMGFEWEEPREVAGVTLTYSDTSPVPPLHTVRVEYWNTKWPTPMPERWQGARSGWIETEDPRQGSWIWARGDCQVQECTHRFFFDPLDITEMNDDKRIEWAEEYNVTYRKTLKIRICFSGETAPSLANIHIAGTAHLVEREAEIRFGVQNTQEDWTGSLRIRNGKILELAPLHFTDADHWMGTEWRCETQGEPKGVRVRFLQAEGSRAQGDQTLITVDAKARRFTFRTHDLAEAPIWIPAYGTLVSKPLPDGDWKMAIEACHTGRDTIYNRVEKEPEQSYERAAKEIPPLDVTKQAPYGRYTILGWEGIKQKYALRYNGEVFADKRQVKMCGRDAAKVRWAGNDIHFRFGTGDPVDFRQRRDASSQWMPEPEVPVYITQWTDREIEFTQTAFGALTHGPIKGPDDIRGDEEMSAMLRLRIRNTTEGSKKVVLYVDITPGEELSLDGNDLLALGRIVPAETVKDGWKIQKYGEPAYRLRIDSKGNGRLAVQPLSEGGVISRSQEIDRNHFKHFGAQPPLPTTSTSIPNALVYEVDLDGFSSHEIDLTIPFTTYALSDARDILSAMDFDDKLDEVKAFWKAFHGQGASLRLPDPILNRFAKAVPWHILMTANKDPFSGNYMVPAGTYAYDVCGNEACMQTRLLDMLGYHDYAERYLETFLHTQGAQMPDGNFTSSEGAFVAVSFDAGKTTLGLFGYNLDHGFILSGFAEHYFMTGDQVWLRRVAKHLVEACEFILREKKATMQVDERGARAPHYGLLPAGHLEDNGEWYHWFAVNGQACGGMLRVAKALAEIDHPDASRLLREAEIYRQDIQAAVQRATEDSPVVRLPDGSSIPHVPTRTALSGRDWGWFREAGYGPLHLVDGLVLAPDDEKVTWILQDQEDNLFVSRLYGRPVDLEKHWFSQGGVTIQANVLNNGLIYLSRDQIPHAIRSLYNNIGQHLYADVLAFSEHPVAELGSGFGPFFKSPDEAQFLVWLRNFLVREEGDTLWICQGVPRRWFAGDQPFEAHGLVSCFGTLDFSISFDKVRQELHASLVLPSRKPPRKIQIRLRHPEGKPLGEVLVNGQAHEQFDRRKELVILDSHTGELKITVKF